MAHIFSEFLFIGDYLGFMFACVLLPLLAAA
jgi:hypothetical protein